jgi:hypothetical protein
MTLTQSEKEKLRNISHTSIRRSLIQRDTLKLNLHKKYLEGDLRRSADLATESASTTEGASPKRFPNLAVLGKWLRPIINKNIERSVSCIGDHSVITSSIIKPIPEKHEDISDDTYSESTIKQVSRRQEKKINLRKDVLYNSQHLDNSLIVTSKTTNLSRSYDLTYDLSVSSTNFEITTKKNQTPKTNKGEFRIKISPEKESIEISLDKTVKKPTSLLSFPIETLKTMTNSRVCSSMDVYMGEGKINLESIEDVHINLVKLILKSKSLVKLQESDFIDENNFNTVVHFEEVDIV